MRDGRWPIGVSDATQLSFDIGYPDLIARLKASKVPWPIVLQHLKFGIDPEHTCGQCSRWLELHVNAVHRSCALAYSSSTVPAETVACRKFRPRD